MPQTSDVAAQHSFRVYHQIQTWLGNKKDWRWKKLGGCLFPVTSLKKPASDCILNFISHGYSGDCTTGKCSCLKAGLTCSDICKNCIRGECLNLKTVSPESADSLDDALQALNDDSDMKLLQVK